MASRIRGEFHDVASGLLVDQFPFLTEVTQNFAEQEPMALQVFDARVRTFIRESEYQRPNQYFFAGPESHLNSAQLLRKPYRRSPMAVTPTGNRASPMRARQEHET